MVTTCQLGCGLTLRMRRSALPGEEMADRLETHSPDQAKGPRSALPGSRSALLALGVDIAGRVLARAAGLG